MIASPPRLGHAARVAFALALAACHGNQSAPHASSDAGVARDAAADGGERGPLAIDVTLTGCETLTAAPLRCTGHAPLSVTFVPISSASVTAFAWTFGDGAPSAEGNVVSHTYALPGTYDVEVTGQSAAGTLRRFRAGAVRVDPNPLGRACDIDAQCAADGGVQCLCGAATVGCGPAFPRGLCTSPCGSAACAAGAVCANLTSPAPAPDAGTGLEPWRDLLCLPACARDPDCATGLSCRILRAGSPAGGWVSACFPAALRPPGASCRAADGRPQPFVCSTGFCSALGAYGTCSLDCSRNPCPAGTACATFNSGASLCLATCTDSRSCTSDPLLSCEMPGAAGPLGFSGPALDTGTAYCAPKSCTSDADCGAAGACLPAGRPGHCSLRDTL